MLALSVPMSLSTLVNVESHYVGVSSANIRIEKKYKARIYLVAFWSVLALKQFICEGLK